jgi:hypothetical protein
MNAVTIRQIAAMIGAGGTRQSEVIHFNMAGIAVKFLSTLHPIGSGILSDVTLSEWRDLNDRSARKALPPVSAAAYGRAARTARKIAQMYGTPIYIWENGKVVAIDPYTEEKLKSKRLKNIKRNKT